MQQEYLTRDEQVEYLATRGIRTTKATLQKKATTGGGPKYVIFGNRALSTTQWLDQWVDQMLKPRGSTSEGEAAGPPPKPKPSDTAVAIGHEHDTARKPQRNCRTCHGTGVVIGKTGVEFDCNCVRQGTRP